MGWFWADTPVSVVDTRSAHPTSGHGAQGGIPPPECPMHRATPPAPTNPVPKAETACPYTPPPAKAETPAPSESKYSKYNPLNYMFAEISQDRAPSQTVSLPTEREPSTIPKGSGEGNWEYPSPQQMYNALLRKGYSDTDVSAVESMVSVHNFLNEGAWAEIVEWERRFGKGLRRGWDICKKGEQGSVAGDGWDAGVAEDLPQPRLMRFMGRPKEMTPKAAMIQVMGKIYPSVYATEPPFDRHDWFVQRDIDGEKTEVRYVIDYYSGPPEPTGEPVFYLDVRPAITPTAAIERMMRWGGDVWYRAAGSGIREQAAAASVNKA